MLNSLPDYVTLAMFRGGRRQDRYAAPGQSQGQAQANAPVQPRPSPPSTARPPSRPVQAQAQRR